ncbi:FAD/NAD(P)-binding protein [Amycolatopsis anabasis]|uniref:FAD/NAD(P)-binding protein n=1 Tax=Amycolatopsis anabasis TaxID=1840409 RepID=UPI00131DE896|nr:FAD/NAD(P)-binding domain-containing protein [Amycolatopsis anabasis]
MTDLAIVGAGAAGTALFIHLVSGAEIRIRRVTFIEPGPLAHGLAFDRTEPYLLCNTSLAVNSLFPDRPRHFEAWLRANGPACARWRIRPRTLTGDTFVPRGLFRHYLAEQLSTALRVATAQGIEVDHVRGRASEIISCGPGLVVRTNCGTTVKAEYVVLSTGLTAPGTAASALAASAGLLRPVASLREDDDFLPERPVVAIVGARQSALDAALVVAHARPEAHLVLMSRSARFPSVRTEMTEHPGQYFTTTALAAGLDLPPADVVDHWRRLLRAEAVANGHDPAVWERPRSGLPGLAEDLARTRAGERAFERMDRNAITVANEVWPFLHERQRAAVRSAFGGLLRRHVSAIPAVSAERLLRLHQQRRLRMTRGPRCWRVAGRRLEFTDFRGRVFTADRAVDATGFSIANSPRLPRWLGRQLSGAHRFVEPGTCHIPVGRGGGIFLLGPPLGDARAVTNYFNATARQAMSVTSFLAGEHPDSPVKAGKARTSRPEAK